MMLTVEIVKMNEEHINGVYEVEKKSFPSPWTKEAFHHEIMNNPYAYYLVLLDRERIIGYCGLWIVMGDAQITNIAIDPDYRGKKLGDQLLVKAKEVAIEKGGSVMSLEVRVSNYIAQSLYKKHGFQPGGIRKNYYVDNNEDALVMWVNL
ncbi:ribosomal protein S18-alanine N-acetyltransferase [Sutcliffiella sp. NC1]|uniref:ribosomal protein S18-alanine N-acetyltransferase n=1 Tax=Sutcliffiella sp. NC1 TaxID=3004096 RepID=UPI0022DD0D23|nr:ribosomal protein S18-alanine N-acetyltransferase [Sutcliffiella sp. NC1]WBL15357.1 ribosomal protein S18-alanine N-acetyltransferase [Sutcliffiella sp. NC1]